MKAHEVNFDGLIGPTHNYAGLAYGNVASMSQKGAVSSPKRAALQGLAKMKLLAELGVKQAVLPPQERPDFEMLGAAGFHGREETRIERAAADAPRLLASAYSASSMWAANAATVSPSADTGDGRVHLTPANLFSQLHRSIESPATFRMMRRLFAESSCFVVHPPLDADERLGDEGAANHTRLCGDHGGPGIEVFTFSREARDSANALPSRYPARQAREASQAIVRKHQLREEDVLFVRQNPAAIDAGVFHNDVVAVGNQNVFLCHEAAYGDTAGFLREVDARLSSRSRKRLEAIVVSEEEVPLKDAVSSYLFNSQVVTLPGGDGTMSIICPIECTEHESTRRFLDDLLSRGTPIRSKHIVDLRQSMNNGGGPACLRLRVVLTEAELAVVHQGVMWSPALHEKLVLWVGKHYRDELRGEDLKDVRLIQEGRDALDELTKILDLPGLYPFQQ
jgi:succinylarginine dihydrolase